MSFWQYLDAHWWVALIVGMILYKVAEILCNITSPRPSENKVTNVFVNTDSDKVIELIKKEMK